MHTTPTWALRLCECRCGQSLADKRRAAIYASRRCKARAYRRRRYDTDPVFRAQRIESIRRYTAAKRQAREEAP